MQKYFAKKYTQKYIKEERKLQMLLSTTHELGSRMHANYLDYPYCTAGRRLANIINHSSAMNMVIADFFFSHHLNSNQEPGRRQSTRKKKRDTHES